MHENVDYMVMEVPSLRENVALVRVTVAAFAARLPFTIAELEELKVAVSEAVTNAVIHGYPGRVGPIRVEAKVTDSQVLVTIVDQGRGLTESKDEHREEPEGTGMGFSFMESFSDEFSVQSSPGEGTTVQLIKRPARRGEKNE